MTTSVPSGDYFSSRPAIRTRVPSHAVAAAAASPGSPRTPLLGRSISSQFGSPGAFRPEQEDFVIYELGARHLSAGFAGEGRPRCVLHFNPDSARRVGDYRAHDPSYRRKRRKVANEDEWGADYELYRTDLRSVDIGLVEDKLERAVRSVHVDRLQLDQKPRKAVLVVPSLLPTPLLEIALKVIFNHSPQPPSVMILTTPLLACVGAGLRNALVIDIGWEETVVTAIGEYKEVCHRRSVRAGKTLTRDMAKLLEEEVKNQGVADGPSEDSDRDEVSFEYAEEVMQRMAWCQASSKFSSKTEYSGMIKLPSPGSDANPHGHIHIPFTRLSKPAETALFTPSGSGNDDHDLPIDVLAYRVLLALPFDLRALCVSRIILTGGVSVLPGLKFRILQELSHLISTRGWDPVHSYGSATAHHDRVLAERSANMARQRGPSIGDKDNPPSSTKRPAQDSIPQADRLHDDKNDSISLKAEREAVKGKVDVVKGVVRGVETLGTWAGASLLMGLKAKGVLEVEKEEFGRVGLKEDGIVM